MKTHITVLKWALCGAAACFALASCSKWLDTPPIDKILEDEAYANEPAIDATCNGLYLKMSQNALYGFNLSSYTVELMGQQYLVSSSPLETYRYNIATFVYSDQYVSNQFKSIWTSSYNLIFDVNYFMSKIESIKPGLLSQSHKDILLGEAYAMRAYMHLDLLRLYGPVYAKDSTATKIPYYTKADGVKLQPIASTEVMAHILADINQSLSLLKNDAVRSDSIRDKATDVGGDFYSVFRNRRLNYYAVQALKVRALMWANRKQEAGTLAVGMITGDMPVKFPWTSDKLPLVTPVNRIFGSEILFGLHCDDMYKNYDSYFSSGIMSSDQVTAQSMTNISALYGTPFSMSTDYRAAWLSNYFNTNYVCSIKFARSAAITDANYLYVQPLIRKSEIYLAAAECKNDAQYLNTQRAKRNILSAGNISGTALQSEITLEFRREFVAEGQLFFYYKRLNQASIPSWTGTSTVSMGDTKYIVPVPKEELN